MTARALLGRISRRAWIGGVASTAVVGAVAMHRTWLPALREEIARAVEPTPLEQLLAALSPTPDIALSAVVDGAASSSPGVLVTIENLGDDWIAFPERRSLRKEAWDDVLILTNEYPGARFERREPQVMMDPHHVIGPGQRLEVHYPLPKQIHADVLGSWATSMRQLTRVLYVTEIIELRDLSQVEMYPKGILFPILARLPSRRVGVWFDPPRPIGPREYEHALTNDRLIAPPPPPMPVTTVPYYQRMRSARGR